MTEVTIMYPESGTGFVILLLIRMHLFLPYNIGGCGLIVIPKKFEPEQ